MGLNTQNASVAATENYGNSYYLGTVTQNADPLNMGRVQAQVPGLYDTTQGEVPWCGSMKDSPYGFGTGPKGPYGVYGFPQVGATIKIELQGGDENKALFTSILTAKDAHPWFNAATRWGYVDPSGNMLQVDMAAGSWTWTHSSGDTLSYDGSGNRVSVVKGNDTDTVSGSLQFNVTGAATINCSSFNLNSSGPAVYKASVHQFQGPVTTNSTLATAGDITDETALGNTRTIGQFRNIYDVHVHHYDDGDTSTPIPQI